MSTFVKFEKFGLALASKKHNLATDQLKIALTNSAPSASADDELADISEVSYANVSTRNVTTTSLTQTAGVAKLILADLILTATGAVGPYRYVVLYNDGATNDDLIGYIDHGVAVTLANGDTHTLDFSVAGALTLT